jgi:hypothetical protein
MSEPAVASAAEAVPRSSPRSPRSPRRWRRRLARAVAVLAGLGVGLGIAELAFRARDDGAFPHLNVYRTDAELGVRLAPGATETFRYADNPITHVRINADGYRGADWPAAGSDEVIVVGDSQTFGLGVEEDETFSAHLAATLHRPVRDAGVPTYGPDEYRAVAAELLAARHPTTVVVGINMVNDLFEASHPNRERHAVWDGWAVRRESAPDEIRDFPGRAWLYRDSHLFFALRKWWHHSDPVDASGVASEGTWTDLIARGREVGDTHAKTAANVQARAVERRALERDLAGADEQVHRAILDVLRDGVIDGDSSGRDLVLASANPGDIVEDNFGAEEARAIVITSAAIRTGAEVRAKLRAKLAAWTRVHKSALATSAQSAITASDAALARLTELDRAKLQAALDPPLLPFVRAMKELCDAHGARLVVVVLPIDVQVSSTEWAKYGSTPVDMTPTLALTSELVAATRALGVTALDTTPVLAAAEPGAFLDRDIHMTAKGHAAVAAALAEAIDAPPPAPVVARASVPVPALWEAAAPLAIGSGSGSGGGDEPGCDAKRVRDWVRVMCVRTEGESPTAVAITHDDTAGALALAVPYEASVLVPFVAGETTAARFSWGDHTRVVHVSAGTGASDAPPQLAWDPRSAGGTGGAELELFAPPPAFASPVEAAVCKCWVQLYRPHPKDPASAQDYEVSRFAVANSASCAGAYGATDARCTTRYAGDCARMFECMWRDPASPPEGD